MAEERFVLEKKLGEGGMGEVWLATDTLLNRPIAVKFLQATDNPVSTILAELGPTAIFLDEAISLDESSAALVHFLIQQGQSPVLLLAEYRTNGDAPAWLNKFSSSPQNRRDDLHSQIAQLLVERRGNPILIGYHYEQLGMATKSAEYLEAAGARAMAANALNQAINCYSRAVELVETQSSYEALGSLYQQQGAWADSIRAFQRALEIASRLNDVNQEARLKNELAFTLWLSDEYSEAAQYASAVLKLPNISKIEEATAQSYLGMIAWLMGHLSEAENWCQKSVNTLMGSGDKTRLAAGYNRLGLVYFSQAKLDQSTKVVQQSLELREKLGDHWGEAYCLTNLARIAIEQGEVKQAAALLDSSLDYARFLKTRGDIESATALGDETRAEAAKIGLQL